MKIDEPTLAQTNQAKRDSYVGAGVGTVYYHECPICGAVRWASSSQKPESELVIEVLEEPDNSRCEVCAYATARHPELAQWIMMVVSKQIHKAMKDAKA